MIQNELWKKLEVLGIEPRALYMQSICSTTELHPHHTDRAFGDIIENMRSSLKSKTAIKMNILVTPGIV